MTECQKQLLKFWKTMKELYGSIIAGLKGYLLYDEAMIKLIELILVADRQQERERIMKLIEAEVLSSGCDCEDCIGRYSRKFEEFEQKILANTSPNE